MPCPATLRPLPCTVLVQTAAKVVKQDHDSEPVTETLSEAASAIESFFELFLDLVFRHIVSFLVITRRLV